MSEEREYNSAEERGYQAKDIADFLAHYFLEPREVSVPLGTIINQLYALLQKQGWKAPE